MSVTINNPWATLTGSTQTMLSWARVLPSYEAVPEVYREACQALAAGSPGFPYLVLAPALGGGRHRSAEKLLGMVNDTLYILERAGQGLVTTGFPFQAVRDIEIGTILLYSWLTLSGDTSEGVAAEATIAYSTSTERYLAPLVNRIRPAPEGADDAGLKAEQAKLDYLAPASFKFMNYARASLLRGETVVRAVWQPELHRRGGTWFSQFFERPLTLAHLTLLTDKEVILIRDDERSPHKRGRRYGGVWRYIPRRHIVSVSVAETAEGLLTLSFGLTAGGRADQVFAASARPELDQLRDDLGPLPPPPPAADEQGV